MTGHFLPAFIPEWVYYPQAGIYIIVRTNQRTKGSD